MEAKTFAEFRHSRSSNMSDRHGFKQLLDQFTRCDIHRVKINTLTREFQEGLQKKFVQNAQDYQRQFNVRFKLFEQLRLLVGVIDSSDYVSKCSYDEDVRDGIMNDKEDEQLQESEAIAKDADFYLTGREKPTSQQYERMKDLADAHEQLLLQLQTISSEKNNSLTQLHEKLDKVADDHDRQLNLILQILTESTEKENQLEEANKKLADSDMRIEQLSAELMSCRVQEQQLSQLQLQLEEANATLKESGAKIEQLSSELTKYKLELLTSRELTVRTKLRQLKELKEQDMTVEVSEMMSRLQKDTATIAEHIKEHSINSNDHSGTGESNPIDTRGSHPSDHLQRLRKNYEELTEKLEARKVAAYMYEQDAVTFKELQSIQRRSTLFEAAEDLLKVVSEAGKVVRVYECFMSALQNTDQQHIWSWLSYEDYKINSEHVQLIKSHYSFLVNTIEHSRLLAELFARSVIDKQDKECLDAEPITFKRNEKLLSMLGRKTQQQFEQFLDCLNETRQGHVVKKLRGNLESPRTSSSHVILSECRKRVVGLTVCDEKLFVLREMSEQIQQYDTGSFQELQAIRVEGLRDVEWRCQSLTSCCINNCFYVNNSHTVFRVDSSKYKVISWSVGGNPFGLSVNATGNVLVTCLNDNEVIEYSTSGSRVRRMKLQVNHVKLPIQTVQLTDGRYVVSHLGPVQGISLIDQHGTLITSYRNSETTQLVNGPRWMVVLNDCILVADSNNNRILSLNSSLNVACALSLPVDSRLNGPWCMYFDQSSGRLLVGECKGEYCVLVFDNIKLT